MLLLFVTEINIIVLFDTEVFISMDKIHVRNFKKYKWKPPAPPISGLGENLNGFDYRMDLHRHIQS